MDSLVHPTQLSVWQRFLQARRLHRETSRSKNPDWYRSALELDQQLHLFIEGDEIIDAQMFTVRGSAESWTKIESPSLQMDEDALRAYVVDLRKEFAKDKARSLGVVLHLADEFAISELARANERPEDLGEISKQVALSPQEVLEDHSISTEELSHRLFPYPGAQSGQQFGAAITITRKHHEFLRMFRTIAESLSVPIRTAALSAPLVALATLPKLVPQVPGQPFSIFFSYSTFSVIAFFTADGDLVMLRSVRHHVGGTPPHVGRIIQTMAAALELPEPLVYVIPLSRGQGEAGAAALPELPNAGAINWREVTELNPDVPLEFQGTRIYAASSEEPQGLAGSRTFRDLADRQWATQDFLPPTQEERELHPSQLEMKALRFGGLGLRVGACVIGVLLAWTGVRAFQVLNDPAWHANKAKTSSEGNKVLAKKIKSYEMWDSFLADRSKAWVTMELMNQLFPNPDSVVIKESSHTVRPEVVRDQDKASLIKEWEMSGFVNDQALEQLTVINTREGISQLFDRVHQITGDESFRTDRDSRNLVINLLASENKRYKPNEGDTLESQFPFMFNLTVTQHISADDPIAIPTVAAP